jgi:uncharacterized membrane protein YbhN (UPF0104 family)
VLAQGQSVARGAVASRSRSLGPIVLGIAGALLFGYLLHHVGFDAVASMVVHLSWKLPILMVVPFVFVTACDTLGWRYAFARDRVPFARLLATRLAGEAVNASTPTASVGGEAVKAWMLKDAVPLAEGVSSVIVAKTTITIAQGLFLLAGLLVAFPVLETGSPLVRGMEWMLGVEALAVAGFVAVQVGGVLDSGAGLLGRLGVLRAAGLESAGRLSSALIGFYRDEPRRLALSIAWHFAGWTLSALETYVILLCLGSPVSLVMAFIIEAIGTGFRFASFMVPAHIGVLEGGQVVTFTALGLSPVAGLSYMLVRRLREVAWVGFGFFIAALERRVAVTRA